MGDNRVKHIYICLNGGKSLKISSRYQWAKKVQIYLQGDLMAIKKSSFACVYMRNISQFDSGERCGPWASCCQFPIPYFFGGSIRFHKKIAYPKIVFYERVRGLSFWLCTIAKKGGAKPIFIYVQFTHECKYLGFIFTCNSKLKYPVVQLADRARKAFYATKHSLPFFFFG
jgi:hypothetical protein